MGDMTGMVTGRLASIGELADAALREGVVATRLRAVKARAK